MTPSPVLKVVLVPRLISLLEVVTADGANAVALVTAAPLALADPSTLVADLTVSTPPLVMLRPVGMKACEVASSTSTATAPATLTDPSEVLAEGFDAPSVPLVESVPLALVSCLLAWLPAKPFSVEVSLSGDWAPPPPDPPPP